MGLRDLDLIKCPKSCNQSRQAQEDASRDNKYFYFLAFVNNFVSICRIANRLKLLVGLATKMDPVTASKGKILIMET